MEAEQISLVVQRLTAELEASSDEIERLRRVVASKDKIIDSLGVELAEIKTRRWYETIEMVTDQRTGRPAVIKTMYRMQIDGIRLELDPGSFSMGQDIGGVL